MLFINGFVLSCVELNTLMNLLSNASSLGRIEQLTTEQLTERFGIIILMVETVSVLDRWCLFMLQLYYLHP